MRMPLNPKQASKTIEKSLGSLDNVIVTNVKQKTPDDVKQEKNIKKKAPTRKKKTSAKS